MNKIIFGLLFCPLAVVAATHYATPHPTFDAETGAEIATVARTQAGDEVEAWSLTNCAAKAGKDDTVILLKGTYDYSNLSRDTSTEGNLITVGSNKGTVSFLGETGNRDDVTVIGGGTNLNLRMIQCQSRVRLESMTVRDFGVQGSAAVLRTAGQNGTVVSNCTFFGNVAQTAGVLSDAWTATSTSVYDSLFESNKFYKVESVSGRAGAGAVSYARCYRCRFVGNGHVTPEVPNQGRGGAACNSALTDCVFIGNSAWIGAAVGGTGHANVESACVRCAFTNNVVPAASSYGICSLTVPCTDCDFFGNSAPGGCVMSDSAFRCRFVSNVCTIVVSVGTIRNCQLVFNDGSSAKNNANALFGNCLAIDNCTIVSNVHPKYVIGACGALRNCFIAGNVKTVGGTQLTSMTYGGYTKGVTNVVADAAAAASTGAVDWKVDAKVLSYLQWGADGTPSGLRRCLGSRESVIDRGIDVGFASDDLDLVGKPRTVGAAVDIGCFEWQGPIPGALLILR